MLKVLLVDDEAIEREGLRLIIERNRSNMEVVAEAKNGKEAVDLALTYQPDIIFMDIKMPEFDGLVAIEKILERLPATKCIMVSAFDTFQYAKRAMQFGIKEYLLKPSKISEVLEAYDRMATEVEKERQAVIQENYLHHRLDRASSLVEMEFILSLMMDHVHEFDTEDWAEWLDLENTRGFVAVFFFKANADRPSREHKSEWYRVLKETLNDQDFQSFVGPLTGYQVPVFIKYEEEKWSRDQLARDIIQSAQLHLLNCQLFVGVGTVVFQLEQFSRSYEEAIYALELVQTNEAAKYLVYNERLQQKRKELVPFEEEKALLEAVRKGEVEAGVDAFSSYYNRIQKNTDYQVNRIKKIMENFFVVLTRVMKELGFKQGVEMSFDQFETPRQIKEATKAHLVNVIKEIGKWRHEGVEGLLVQAKDYIHSHYQKNITLEEVADHVDLSSYYLSKLFKEHFHITFIEYVTNTRLKKAKELLLGNSMSLKEIALTIGYKDPNYFSRVFKKEVGVSPSEYRKKH